MTDSGFQRMGETGFHKADLVQLLLWESAPVTIHLFLEGLSLKVEAEDYMDFSLCIGACEAM
jgi:hypothetical protein